LCRDALHIHENSAGEELLVTRPRTIIDKLWDAHVIAERPGGEALLWIDRHFLHEGSFHAFGQLDKRGERVAEPSLTFGVADHYVPVRTRAPATAEIGRMVSDLSENARKHGLKLFGVDDPGQGIVHVIGPEQGLTLPGLTIVCGDSHTSTHGAFGAYAFGIGASEVAHVLMTQTLWQKKPKRMRICVDGALGSGVTAKDIILSVIAKIGADGARGHAIEYAGGAIRALDMAGRMTVCNMSIEAGGRLGIVAPDETTFRFVDGRAHAPRGDAFKRACDDWLSLTSDADAAFDNDISLHGNDIAPTVTWGISPEDALPIGGRLPDPARIDDTVRKAYVADALTYMGLTAGAALTSIAIDRVFIGSCTNSRIEDLRAAARVLAGRRAAVPGLVSPGSKAVKQQAEEEGLDAVFRAAGLEWAGSGCSMCVGINGDQVAAGERCASTTNRNFKGRQGQGARTHLMSPAMAAAAALMGHLTDVRTLT
jgi:3-isopropylmalate/(R)-2-methylmalate dehydratase large subunit